MKTRYAVAVFAAVVAPHTLFAQSKSQTAGFQANLHINGSAIKPEDEEREKGGGLGLALGYGFNRSFMVFVNVDGANMAPANAAADDYGLGHGDLGVRYSFANESRSWIPFIDLAVTARSAVFENVVGDADATLSGGGLSAGGGVSYFFSRAWAIEGSLHWTGGKFTQVKIGSGGYEDLASDEVKATTARLAVGVSFHPKK
ncbi:MAG: outer membrane beta-barrel protein [Longimicrobiales bacterium]